MLLQAVFLFLLSISKGLAQEPCYPNLNPVIGILNNSLTEVNLKYSELQAKQVEVEVKLAQKQEKLHHTNRELGKLQESLNQTNIKYEQVQKRLNEANLQNAKLQADIQRKDVELFNLNALIEQQKALISQLQDQKSDLKKSCELGKLKDLFSEELDKFRGITKSSQDVKNSTTPIKDRCQSTQEEAVVYSEIQLPGLEPFNVNCISDVNIGYGWIQVFFKHIESRKFNVTYEQYINGFGDSTWDSTFIGLQKLHILTSWKPHEVFINSWNRNTGIGKIRCDNLVVGDENEDYMLKKVDGCTENTLEIDLVQGTKFSTIDRDEDGNPEHNWAEETGFGWWFSSGMRHFEESYLVMLIRIKE